MPPTGATHTRPSPRMQPYGASQGSLQSHNYPRPHQLRMQQHVLRTTRVSELAHASSVPASYSCLHELFIHLHSLCKDQTRHPRLHAFLARDALCIPSDGQDLVTLRCFFWEMDRDCCPLTPADQPDALPYRLVGRHCPNARDGDFQCFAIRRARPHEAELALEVRGSTSPVVNGADAAATRGNGADAPTFSRISSRSSATCSFGT
ncbi:hypothetical protein THASP1DRAFT_33830 [Thamnocephalis sphaerospora]|uniref:Uncharacterized protein n=1 Tax=Thamnocephalis sphaerospora TaxID=78915 RepID=A0A4V1IVK8_9FUNG|nr:hypothetical protein THASP1DRAFT_33830 [Thamnocephalis sphaerospora]|eukprot:RKP04409.1 hypothetical protein THASP1DRAFT_33830 [Thamnocephalis sphaerospora]